MAWCCAWISRRSAGLAIVCAAFACTPPAPAASVVPPSRPPATSTEGSALPSADVAPGKALVFHVLVERSGDTDAEAIVPLIAKQLAALQYRVLLDMPPSGADARADVLVFVRLEPSNGARGGSHQAGSGGSEATIAVTARDRFGVAIGTSKTSYLIALGPGPQHIERLLQCHRRPTRAHRAAA